MMPVNINDLRPGDRVILNCPKSRIMTKREAQFEGVYHSLKEAVEASRDGISLVDATAADFLERAERGWAGFLLGTSPGGMELRGAFIVEADGSLREQEGRRVIIERRLGRVGVG